MNVGQMHIAVNQGVQKVASSQVDLLLPEEIDLELNKAQMKFIKTRYSQFGNKYMRGFEGSQKRIDDLRTLITEVSLDTTYKGQISKKHHIDTCVLPDNYMFLVNQRSLSVHNNCHPINFGQVETGQYWIELPINESNFVCDSRQIYDWTDPTYTPPRDCSNYMQTICGGSGLDRWFMGGHVEGEDIDGNPMSVGMPQLVNPPLPPTGNWSPNTYVDYQPTITSSNAYYSLTTPDGNQPSYQSAGGVICVIFPVGFILPDLTANYCSAPVPLCQGQWQYDALGGACTTQGAATQTHTMNYASFPVIDHTDSGAFIQTSRDTISSFDLNDLDLQTESAGNRWAQHDDIYSMLDDPFNTTKHTSPLTTIRGNSIDVYTDNSFFVPKVKISYIRRPVDININGSDCSLPIHTHEEIVAMTVASILESFTDGRYQTIQNELMGSE